MEVKGIIFDLDGVIVSTDRMHYQAWKVIADQLGIPFDETENDRLRGVSRMQSLEIILEKYPKNDELTDQDKSRMAEEKNGYYVELLRTMSRSDVAEEVIDTLRYLREKGYLLAIGSSSKNAGIILDQTGIRDLFDAVSDGNNISKSKPNPEVFIKAAQYLDLPLEKCAVVEDAEAGILAAKAGGMVAIGIGAAFGCEKADCYIKAFKELKTLF